MKQRKPFPDPATAQPLMDEVDIGSGEKTPGERETEEFVRGIGPDVESPRAEPARRGAGADSESSRGAEADRQGERGAIAGERAADEGQLGSEQLDTSMPHQPLEQQGRMEPAAPHG